MHTRDSPGSRFTLLNDGHISFVPLSSWLDSKGSRPTTFSQSRQDCPRAQTRTHVASIRNPEAMYRTAAPRQANLPSAKGRVSGRRSRGLVDSAQSYFDVRLETLQRVSTYKNKNQSDSTS